jgi:ligand-binding sensor domain-containing protein/signal transduction histidine kinase
MRRCPAQRAVVAILFAITGHLIAEQLPIQAYTTADGLTHNHINRIRQDSRGFLWLCTDEGLTRFDGRDFKKYTHANGLPHAWVNDFLEARDGTYWVATDAGVVQFNPTAVSDPLKDRRSGRAATPMFSVVGPENSNEARRVNALAEDKDGSILCATYAGLYRLQRAAGGLKFKEIEVGLPKDTMEGRLINNLTASRHGGWWLAARYGLCRLFEDGRWQRFMLSKGLPDNFVETVYEDRAGRVWAGTRSHGLCLLRPTSASDGRIVDRCYSVADGLPDSDVRSIFQSSDGTFWIGTAGGLSEFSPEANPPLFRNYSAKNGLSDPHILKMTEDSDGNLWLGTMHSGVMKMVRQGFVSFDGRDGFLAGTNHDSLVETASGEVSIISEAGDRLFVQVLHGGKFQSSPLNVPVVRGGLNPQRSGSLQDRKGEWWIGTGHGLFRFPQVGRARDLSKVRPKGLYTTADGFAGNNIAALYEDSRGDIWIANNSFSAHGLSRWSRSNGTLQHYTEASPGLKHWRASAFQQDASGDFWIGLVDGHGMIRCRQQQFEPLAAPEGAFRGLVREIHLDHAGRLWVATSQAGLTRIDGPDTDQPRLSRYTVAEGLSSNDVCCVTEDQSGKIYAGTNSGVDRLDPATGRIRHFTVSDGLVKGAILLAHRDARGALWFVTNNGVSRLVPARDPPSRRTVLIRGLRIMGVPYPISEVGETEISGIEIPPGENEMQLDFAGLDFRPGPQLQYQYKMEGADGSWGSASTERSVHYANLAPGAYRFSVRAISSDGTSPPAVVSFRVLAPVWRRSWFLALALAATLAAAYALHRYRVSQLLELERVRTRIATDLHDDVGASLSQIAILSELAGRRLNGESPHLARTLAEIGNLSRELVDSMSDIVWAINPAHDKLSDLVHRMRRFATETLTAKEMVIEFQAPAEDEHLQTGAEARRQIFLIFKEAINNIGRHSQATRAEVEFASSRGVFELRLRDNGIGFSVDEVAAGNGLSSIRKRASELGGSASLRSAPGEGTEWMIHIPRLGTRSSPHREVYRGSRLLILGRRKGTKRS